MVAARRTPGDRTEPVGCGLLCGAPNRAVVLWVTIASATPGLMASPRDEPAETEVVTVWFDVAVMLSLLPPVMDAPSSTSARVMLVRRTLMATEAPTPTLLSPEARAFAAAFAVSVRGFSAFRVPSLTEPPMF